MLYLPKLLNMTTTKADALCNCQKLQVCKLIKNLQIHFEIFIIGASPATVVTRLIICNFMPLVCPDVQMSFKAIRVHNTWHSRYIRILSFNKHTCIFLHESIISYYLNNIRGPASWIFDLVRNKKLTFLLTFAINWLYKCWSSFWHYHKVINDPVWASDQPWLTMLITLSLYNFLLAQKISQHWPFLFGKSGSYYIIT